MHFKWIGAILIIAGCGGCGFSAAAAGKRESKMLQELLGALRFMECELQFQLTALPELCRQAGKRASGAVREVFFNLARELDWQQKPDAPSCMAEALEKSRPLPRAVRTLFLQLGSSLGRFDLAGQLKELSYTRTACEAALQEQTSLQSLRHRNYRTLGLCTGAALALLFL